MTGTKAKFYDPPRPTRDVVLEMDVDGWTPVQIAAKLGISRQTVHYHLKRAKGGGK